ncbi:hypothetical protein EYB45_01435 [Erythrobacteraceae bacterium CFH 75059]|uniref:hypothetical protein n=1 Tax=Qipengyuania thermophila TaxID=2509361 RepID=UPI00101EB93C|nr:hypothetical protein [Qipengyuania thermophila]TCD06417.1 hypothetical protein EYB45_01435 [Erythrobacteraceae bacterium CFH 75059]
MRRLVAALLATVLLTWSHAGLAAVQLHFHSFNGSMVGGRYPHTFIVLEGTLQATGAPVNENYGFTARRVTPAILRGPVEHMIMTEQPRYIQTTNRHFSVTLTDAQYRAIVAEVARWRNAPGRFYDLDTRNCIHFVGAIAEIVGIRVEYPQAMLRRPKQWLNHIATLNPKLGARPIR